MRSEAAFRLLAATAVAAAVLVTAPTSDATAQEGGDPVAPAGMVYLAPSPKQPIGMSPKEIETFLEKELKAAIVKRKNWEHIWAEQYLLMTPAHTVSVPALFMQRYEVSNAQWKVFIDSARNQRTVSTTSAVRTLEDVTASIWLIDPEHQAAAFQSAWLYLMYRNWERLEKHLNPDGKADWDPLVALAHKQELPGNVELEYSRIPPPFFWNRDGRRDGSVQDEELDRPARSISYIEAMEFARWAGYHLPREIEWARAARGPEGRRFPWGNEWKPTACVYRDYNKALRGAEAVGEPVGPNPNVPPPHPATVDSFEAYETPERIRHLVGNVTEWLVDRALVWEGSEARFGYNNQSLLARGGNYDSEAHTLLAAQRVWEAGGPPLEPGVKPEGYGVRLAGYTNAAMDLTLPVYLSTVDPNVRSGPSLWMPTPLGLTAKERISMTNKKKALLTGVSFERSVGVLERAAEPANTDHHVYVTGPAKGVALLPTKGFLSKVIPTGTALKKLATKGEQLVFLGVLVGTQNASIEVLDDTQLDEEGEAATVTVSFARGSLADPGIEDDCGPLWSEDPRWWYYKYPVGVMLVLKGERVAVYPADPRKAGNPDAHLLKGKPIGYLPLPWSSEWKPTKDAKGTAQRLGANLAIKAVLPQLGSDGQPAKSGRSAIISIEVPVKFTDE